MNSITKNTADLVTNCNLMLHNENYKVEVSRDKKKIIRAYKDGKWVYLGSKYNVDRDIDNVLDKLVNINSQNLIIIFGLGSGEYIKQLLESVKEENRILIVS